MDKQLRRLTLLIATMAIALVLSAGAAVALTLDCTAGRGCVGTDEPDTLNGSIGNDGEDWMQGDAYAPTDTSTDGDDRLFGGASFDGMIGYGGDDLLSGGTRGDFIDAKENSENPGEDTVRGGRGRDYIDAIDMTKDTINCGNGTKDEVFYDENLDSVENCEIASTEYPEEFIGAASAEETNTLSAR